MRRLPFFVFAIMLIACNTDTTSLRMMEDIKAAGNSNPVAAMHLLDSIGPSIKNSSEYARNKYELLRIRLSDKADIIPTTDSVILSLIPYFNSHGTPQDKQEAYYYAGSVYRDLQDAPRALEYFLQSSVIGAENGCDSIMLRNTFSNLCWLYYNVQDYNNALAAAKEELRLSEQMNLMTDVALSHVGILCIRIDSLAIASFYTTKAYEMIKKNVEGNQYKMAVMLINFTYLKDYTHSKECLDYIHEHYGIESLLQDHAFCLAAGQYFKDTGQLDSARYYYQQIIDQQADLETAYDASRHLFLIDHKLGNTALALQDAERFIVASDSLNLGKRQELAATVNNQFKYYRNKEEERRIKEENGRKNVQMAIVSSLFILFVLLSVIYYLYNRKRRLESLVRKKEELDRLTQAIEQKDRELAETRKALGNKTDEARRMTDELIRINGALENEKTELELAVKQNTLLLRNMHERKLEDSGPNVIKKIKLSAESNQSLSEQEWLELYSAVDEMYPDFCAQIAEKQGIVNGRQLQMCYLMRIGMTNVQIENLTGIPAVTVWRYAKKLAPLLNLPLRPTRKPRKKKD